MMAGWEAASGINHHPGSSGASPALLLFGWGHVDTHRGELPHQPLEGRGVDEGLDVHGLSTPQGSRRVAAGGASHGTGSAVSPRVLRWSLVVVCLALVAASLGRADLARAAARTAGLLVVGHALLAAGRLARRRLAGSARA